MPPGGIAGIADFGSGFSATIASVVIRRPAIDKLHQQDPHRSYKPDGSEQTLSAQHALGAA